MRQSSRLILGRGVFSQLPRSTILKASPLEMTAITKNAMRIATVAAGGAKRRSNCMLTITNLRVTESFGAFKRLTGPKISGFEKGQNGIASRGMVGKGIELIDDFAVERSTASPS